MHPICTQIAAIFDERGANSYGSERVTQLQHALQCARLAEKEGAPSEQVAAALLHDIGHMLDPGIMGDSEESDDPSTISLDDAHEERGYRWLSAVFGPSVAEPVRLHVAAKRYLCTVEPDYAGQLSPTSYQSYIDQGGEMSMDELAAFEEETYFIEAIRLRKWDDMAKDPERAVKPLAYFLPHVESCLR